MRFIKRTIVHRLLYLFLIIFIVARVFGRTPAFLERAVAIVSYPAIVVASTVYDAVSSYHDYWKTNATLREERDLLLMERDRLLEQMTEREALVHVSKESAEIRSFAKRYNLEQAPIAKILSRTLTDNEQMFSINRGASHGIKRDMIALYKLQVVGRVVEVYDWYSVVMLITDKRSKIASYANSTDAQGIVEGTNNPQEYLFSHVNHLDQVCGHDVVISSGQGMVFPEGYCVGMIVENSLEDKALYHTIKLAPLVDFAKIKYCLLIDQTMTNLF